MKKLAPVMAQSVYSQHFTSWFKGDRKKICGQSYLDQLPKKCRYLGAFQQGSITVQEASNAVKE